MARKAKSRKKQASERDLDTVLNEAEETQNGDDEDLVPEGKLVCALTGEHKTVSPQEETLQSFIEQLHREYAVELEDMARDFRVTCVYEDTKTGRTKTRSRTVSLVVFEPGAEREINNIIRVAVVAKPGTKASAAAIGLLEEVLANLSEERPEVFGLWTNGAELAFRMRTFEKRMGTPLFTELTDFPAPHETLEDLETGERRPLRIAAGDSLLRTFKRCHDYLYGNQSMRGDRAFWQLLHLIFCKIYDEQQSSRAFFVGATEANTDAGRKRVAKRIHSLFKKVRDEAYKDVFDGTERIELNDRALAIIAGELGRYSLLSTDTDAKGLAYEAITSTTLKRERGQFFTPRNVIRMMVEMLDPQPGKKILDPACGSGGFLVVAMAQLRKHFLQKTGGHPDLPIPSELKRVEKPMRNYARSCLYGIDVDPDLRKAARMNMVMNNDGHGNILCFNALEYGIPDRRVPEMEAFESNGGGHGKFDYVFTNPPFGSKIPIVDPAILETFDLGHTWDLVGGTWQKGGVQKKVPPEILFIEACCKFLKPGTGEMAIVLPNGILGNPGLQMEAVRWWMLYHMELLASIDLPAEAFQPQISIQASCVFLRRRHQSELRLTGSEGPGQRPVFMAIGQSVGHGRRGETRYMRGPDGREILHVTERLERWERNGRVIEKVRRQEVRQLDDDLPWIARQYRNSVSDEPWEQS
ncbi:MAG: N-6 DNA methylase [Planctomycetaceae bacterium]|nr:N-6 DNA methylase [Planctomycetaceae bacterium]